MKFMITSHIDKPVVNVQVINAQNHEYGCPRCSGTIIVKDYFGTCRECRTEISGPLLEC